MADVDKRIEADLKEKTRMSEIYAETFREMGFKGAVRIDYTNAKITSPTVDVVIEGAAPPDGMRLEKLFKRAGLNQDKARYLTDFEGPNESERKVITINTVGDDIASAQKLANTLRKAWNEENRGHKGFVPLKEKRSVPDGAPDPDRRKAVPSQPRSTAQEQLINEGALIREVERWAKVVLGPDNYGMGSDGPIKMNPYVRVQTAALEASAAANLKAGTREFNEAVRTEAARMEKLATAGSKLFHQFSDLQFQRGVRFDDVQPKWQEYVNQHPELRDLAKLSITKVQELTKEVDAQIADLQKGKQTSLGPAQKAIGLARTESSQLLDAGMTLAASSPEGQRLPEQQLGLNLNTGGPRSAQNPERKL